MFKEQLAAQQPIVYRTLSNGLKQSHLSHCYLFVGQKGTLKKETAFLLAQSIICSNSQDEFGCEECLECIRIKENNYIDLIYIDGSNETIKVDEITNLQSQFQKTALEKAGKKIFIINACENMTVKAANSLLKFIEEPVGSITGIFITSNVERVLPTIISRCQTIFFKPLNNDTFYKKAKELNFDELSCHLLSNIVSNVDELNEYNKAPTYTSGVNYFTEYMTAFFDNRSLAQVYLQENKFEVQSKKSDRGANKEAFSFFLLTAKIFANDLANNVNVEDDTWSSLIDKAKKNNFNPISFLKIVTECKDALNTNTNVLLLVDQFLYKMKEELS